MEISSSTNQTSNAVSAAQPKPSQTESFFTNLLSQFTSDGQGSEDVAAGSGQTQSTITANSTAQAPLSKIVNHAISTALDSTPTDQAISPELVNLFQNSLLEALTASLYQAPAGATMQESAKAQTQTDLVSIDDTVAGNSASEKSLGASILDVSFGDDGFGMDDVFDTVNVLNHIPIVSDIYQEVSENTVDAFSSLAGGFMLYGPAGLALSAVNVATEQLTGESLVGNAVNFATDLFNSMMSDDTPTDAELASNATQPDTSVTGLSSATLNNGGVR